MSKLFKDTTHSDILIHWTGKDIDKSVIFIDKSMMKGSLFCKFAIAFGVNTICACPVRKEIYRKYGV